MTEDTVGDCATEGKQKKQVSQNLRGVSPGMLCRSIDVRESLGMSKETWRLWRDAGLKTIGDVGTDAELIFTDEVFIFLASKPKIGPRKTQRKPAK